MLEMVTGHAGIAAVVAFFLYALAIYKVVDIVKRLTEHLAWLQPYRVAMAAVIGGMTGPLIYPWIFELTGAAAKVPFFASIIMGLGTGGIAVNIHALVEQRLGKKA